MPRTRFAPSPTGHLHKGHAFSAWFAWRLAGAGRDHGDFILRIEDIDRSRCRPIFVQSILDDLAWLGFKWSKPVRHQSDHFADYQAALDQMADRGLLYPCFCTRRQIAAEIAAATTAPHEQQTPLIDPVYPGTCRRLAPEQVKDSMQEGKPYALRLDSERALESIRQPLEFICDGETLTANPAAFGDIILARRDCPTSYHLSVVVDDAAQGIDLVTRGIDLKPAAQIHRLLQALLDLPVPKYQHHPLILDEKGQRLAKRADSLSLATMRESGLTASDILKEFAQKELADVFN